jgi:hypothetical protein
MDGLVEELLRLENAKHKALVSIDAPTYDASIREQLRLLDASKGSLTTTGNVGELLTLSQLITVNTRLLENLLSTTPLVHLSAHYYTAEGRMSVEPTSGRVSVEA